MGINVIQMSKEDRLREVLIRSKNYFGPEGKQLIDSLLSPENIAIMIGTLLIWAGSHLFGIGEIIDVLLLIVGAATIGWSIGDVANNIYTFADLTINARSEEDLDTAAKAFSHAAVQAGFTTIMALLLRCSVKKIQATRGANVMDAMRPRNPGLAGKVGIDPEKGKMWSDPKVTPDASLPAGVGRTSAFGETFFSIRGTVMQEKLVIAHEAVHRFLSPRFGIFRTFRARLKMSGYLRSALLQYLEEALAETYARLKVNGFGISELKAGILFPTRNGYLVLKMPISQALVAESAAIGSILVAREIFLVQFTFADFQNEESAALDK